MAPHTRGRDVSSRVSKRRVRVTRKSYREDSTSVSDSSDDATYSQSLRDNFGPGPASSTGSSRPRASRKKRQTPSSRFPPSGLKRARRNSNANRCEESTSIHQSLPVGRIPAWQALPYHILVQVFCYAAQPVITKLWYPTSSPQWLARTALVCKAFSEPALTILYQAPPLSPSCRARRLLLQLQSQNQSSAFNYQSKVRYLEVDAIETLHRKDKGHEPIDIGELIAVTPQLRGINIHLRTDRTHPLLPRSVNILPKNKAIQALRTILVALEAHNILLEEWKWGPATGDCLSHGDYGLMGRVHRSSHFERISRINIVAFDSWHNKTPQSETLEELFGSAMSSFGLPHLQELHVTLSPLVRRSFLHLLPKTLQVLEIAECPVESKTMKTFLDSHGSQLRYLILNHNQSLNLSFLVELEKYCPVLEALTMDLTYFNAHQTFSDNEPRYELLMERGEVPTWPTSLQRLELLHLRKWDNDMANDFFNSLVKAAKDLKSLRYLNIKASLSESGWRERIAFRDRWYALFRKIFLRASPPPDPHLRSLDTWNTFKALKASQTRKNDQKTNGSPRKLRFSRVEVPVVQNKQPNQASDVDSSDQPLVLQRRSARLKSSENAPEADGPELPEFLLRPHPSRRRRRRRATYSSDDQSSEDSALDDDPSFLARKPAFDPSNGEDELYIQGMCDTVRISLDNLRPMEEQLGESDFLDTEISGDEDWNGDDDGFDAKDGYAW